MSSNHNEEEDEDSTNDGNDQDQKQTDVTDVGRSYERDVLQLKWETIEVDHAKEGLLGAVVCGGSIYALAPGDKDADDDDDDEDSSDSESDNDSDDSKNESDRLVQFHIHTRSVTTVATKPLQVQCHAMAATSRNKLFFIGGETRDRECTEQDEYYDLKKGEWKTIPAMPTRRHGCACAVLQDKLYVIGGCDTPNGDNFDTVEVLDMKTNRWSKLPSIPTARYECVALPVNNEEIYVLGGLDEKDKSCNKVEVFNVQKQEWRSLAPMPTKRDDFGATVVGNCIVVAGGSDGRQTLTSVELYSLEYDEWYSLPSLPSTRSGCSAQVLDDTLYVIGGSFCANHDEPHKSIQLLKLPHVFCGIPLRTPVPSIRLVSSLPAEFRQDKYVAVLRQWVRKAKKQKEDYKESMMEIVGVMDEEVKTRTTKLQVWIEKLQDNVQKQHSRWKQARASIETNVSTMNEIDNQIESALKIIEAISMASGKEAEGVAKLEDDQDHLQLLTESNVDVNEPPSELVCPITYELMQDPVVAADGYTYEKHAIRRFFGDLEKPRSPVTGEDLTNDVLLPNLMARRLCREWKERQRNAGETN